MYSYNLQIHLLRLRDNCLDSSKFIVAFVSSYHEYQCYEDIEEDVYCY